MYKKTITLLFLLVNMLVFSQDETISFDMESQDGRGADQVVDKKNKKIILIFSELTKLKAICLNEKMIPIESLSTFSQNKNKC